MAQVNRIISYIANDDSWPQITPQTTHLFDGDGSQTYANWRPTNDAGVALEKPSLADVQAVNNLLDAQDAARQSQLDSLIQDYNAIVGLSVDVLDLAQMRVLLLAVAYHAGAIDKQTLKVRALSEWINNS